MLEMPEAAREAIARLEAAGQEAWLVGGSVRDLLRGCPPGDLDLATSALPEETERVFSGERVIETGRRHGTVTVLLGGVPLEITTCRVDGDYSDNRHPDGVRFTRSLREDLARRDFTINAMALRDGGELVDCFGGQEDLRAGLIRCVGDPDRRFQEDGLRILRALRFSSKLGFSIERETAAAIRRNRALLAGISAERIRAELTGLLCGPDARRVLLAWPEVLGVPLPELLPMVGFDQRTPYHCYDVWQHTAVVVENCPPEPVLRWAALLHDIGKPAAFSVDDRGVGHFYGHAAESVVRAEPILRRLKFDNASRDRILLLVEHHDARPAQDETGTARRLRRLGEEAYSQLLKLGRADNLGQNPDTWERQARFDRAEALLSEVLAEQRCFSLRDLAVNGSDLTARGLTGPAVGETLERLLDAVIAGEVPNEKAALLRCLDDQDA